MITYEDFSKVEIRVGKILSAEKIPDTDKLLKLSVDFGVNTNSESGTRPYRSVTFGQANVQIGTPAPTNSDVGAGVPETPVQDIRQIVSGISAYFPDPAILVGKQCMFVTNLEPRKIRGYDSNGMLFAVSTPDGKFSLLEPSLEIPPGTKAK